MIEVKAPLTGTIWKIECKEGDSVEEGDVLIIMESMKMEMKVDPQPRLHSLVVSSLDDMGY